MATKIERLQNLAEIAGKDSTKEFKDGTESIECTILDGQKVTWENVVQELTHEDIISLVVAAGNVEIRRAAAAGELTERRKKSAKVMNNLKALAESKGMTVEELLASLNS